MTIDKAIRRLRSYLRLRKPEPDDNFYESVQLGMEALKEKAERERRSNHENLPGN